MTHAVAAWPPDRPGGVVVGKTTHVWYPRVSVAGPAIPSCSVAVVACVGNPGSIWGNVRFHCAPVWYYSASHTHTFFTKTTGHAGRHGAPSGQAGTYGFIPRSVSETQARESA